MTSGRDHEPTDQTRFLVAELYAAGIQKERIAQRLGICDDTLNKYYSAELDANKENLIAKLGKSQYQKAIEGDQKAAEFWLKCQGGWSYSKPPEQNGDLKVAAMELLMDKLS